MSLRWPVVLVLVSTAGFIPGSSRGQEVPRNFQAFADGDDIVVRWSASGRADFYVGEVDEDPQFDSPARWTVRGDGRGTYERRFSNLDRGTYYLRVRALEAAVVIRRQSDWSHVERVVIGGSRVRGGSRDDDLDDDEPWIDYEGVLDDEDLGGRDRRRFPVGNDFPRRVETRAFGDDLHITWSPVREADGYLVQIDTDRRFRTPRSFTVSTADGFSRSGRATQVFRVRNVPPDRYYVRVRAVDSFLSRDRTRWSEVAIVDVESRGRDFDREADFGEGRAGVLHDRRERPIFGDDDHPGRGKGHLKHEDKKRNRGHSGDRDRRGWDDRDRRWWDRATEAADDD